MSARPEGVSALDRTPLLDFVIACENAIRTHPALSAALDASRPAETDNVRALTIASCLLLEVTFRFDARTWLAALAREDSTPASETGR